MYKINVASQNITNMASTCLAAVLSTDEKIVLTSLGYQHGFQYAAFLVGRDQCEYAG